MKGLEKIVLPETLPHIWVINLDINDRIVKSYSSLLSQDEKQRASRFKFQKDFRAYVITRACLRLLLADYLNMNPLAVKFNYSKYGKPTLANEGCNLKFNVSHSSLVSLIGFSKINPIGVDIEFIKFDKDLNNVAQRFFSKVEFNEFESLNESDKPKGFFNCWTRKEAFIKAVGQGLSFPLKEFDVSLKPGEKAELLAIHGDRVQKKKWSLADLSMPEGYTAAFAVQGVIMGYELNIFNIKSDLEGGPFFIK